MKRFSLLFGAALLPLFFGGCTPEVAAFGKSAFFNLAFIIPLLTATILIVFALNKWIVDEHGRTKNGLCAAIGAPIFTFIFAIIIGWKFDFTMPAILIGGAIGLIIGLLSFTLDELMANFWENKEVNVPGALGLMVGGWIVISMFTHVWQEGNMFITHQACDNRVIVERYTYHTDGKDSHYSWDYKKHYDKLAMGYDLPKMVEGKDYVLGTGANDELDRTKTESYYFIGGQFFSEEKNEWDDFEWLLLANPSLQVKLNQVQLIQSNFYGNPMKNAGIVTAPKKPPEPKAFVPLPSTSLLPAGEIMGKTFTMAFGAIGLLFNEKEYRPILYFFLFVLLILILLAIFVPPLRMSIGIFVICASVIILLLLLVAAAKSGGLRSSRREGSGGGRFNGRGNSY